MVSHRLLQLGEEETLKPEQTEQCLFAHRLWASEPTSEANSCKRTRYDPEHSVPTRLLPRKERTCRCAGIKPTLSQAGSSAQRCSERQGQGTQPRRKA